MPVNRWSRSTAADKRWPAVNAEVIFPKSAEVKFPTFRRSAECDQSLSIFLGRPGFLRVVAGAEIGGKRRLSGTNLACSRKR